MTRGHRIKAVGKGHKVTWAPPDLGAAPCFLPFGMMMPSPAARTGSCLASLTSAYVITKQGWVSGELTGWAGGHAWA